MRLRIDRFSRNGERREHEGVFDEGKRMIPRWRLGRSEILTPWFGLFWGYCAYRVLDFYIAFDWERDWEPKRRYCYIFRHGIEFGWDWLPTFRWHDNRPAWLDEKGNEYFLPKRYWKRSHWNLIGWYWARYFEVRG